MANTNVNLPSRSSLATGRGLALFAGLVLLIVMVGWAMKNSFLFQITTDWPPMVPVTAVGIGLLTLSVIIQSYKRIWAVWLGRALTVPAGLLGVWILLEYFVNLTPRVDTLIWSDTVNQLMIGMPGRPSPQEAWVLIFAAVGYMFLQSDGKTLRIVSVTFQIASWLIPVMVVTGYVYEALSLYILRGDTGMSLIAAVCFLVVGAAAAFIRADRPPLYWITSSMERPTILRLIFVAVMIPLVYRIMEVMGAAAGMDEGTADALALLTTAASIVLGVLSIGRSERKSAALLREEKERFSIAFEDAPVGMSVLSKDGMIIQANFALVTLTQLNVEDLNGSSFWDILWEPDFVFVEQNMESVINETIPQFRGDVRLVTSTREPVWVDLHMTAVHDGDGNFSYLLMQALDLTDRKKVERYLAYQATHDPLTGLPNRAKLEEYLDNVSTGEQVSNLSLVFFDLNYFKEVNDTYGHDVGDEVLIEIAARLQRTVRAADFVARLGGDEFVMVVQNDDANDLLMDRLRAAVEGDVIVNGYVLDIKVSIGIAPLLDGDHKRAIAAADRAMYEDKLRIRF